MRLCVRYRVRPRRQDTRKLYRSGARNAVTDSDWKQWIRLRSAVLLSRDATIIWGTLAREEAASKPSRSRIQDVLGVAGHPEIYLKHFASTFATETNLWRSPVWKSAPAACGVLPFLLI